MSKFLAHSVDYECVGLSIERPPFYRMARILGIPRKSNAFYRMRKFLECAEHTHVQLCRFGNDSFTQDSARLTKEERKNEQFAWAAISKEERKFTTLETCARFAKGISMLRTIA